MDRFAALDRQVQAFKPVSDEHEKLKTILKSWGDSAPGDQTVTLPGNLVDVVLTQRENKTSIRDMAAVWKAFGRVRFLELCSFTLKALDELAPSKRARIETLTERTGTRKVQVVAKISGAPAVKAA